VEVLNVSVVFVEGDLVPCSGSRNAFQFAAVFCYLFLTGLFARQLASGLCIPVGFCMVVR
jgi:hypothetical protein